MTHTTNCTKPTWNITKQMNNLKKENPTEPKSQQENFSV